MALNPVEILGRVPFDPSRPALPLFIEGVAAGFPSPADDYIDRNLDLHEHLIEHPAATFFVRASGNSMVGAGIHDGDLLVVDRAVQPRDGHVVIAAVHGELTVKRLRRNQGRLYLVSDGNGFPPLAITEDMDLHVWGVCRYVIHGL
jgi:DNA polymerase V